MASYCPNCGRKTSEFGTHKCVNFDTSPLAEDAQIHLQNEKAYDEAKALEVQNDDDGVNAD